MTAALRIGLTGDVGAGKSTVLAWLRERGAATLDADRVVHRLLSEDDAVIAAIAARFGAPMRTPAGIDRERLGRRVFADAAALSELESILFPVVREKSRAWIAQRSGVAVFEAVKLVESDMAGDFDQLWLIVTARDQRRVRLQGRGWSEDQIGRRMAAGGPLAPRLALADEVIDNSGERAATWRQLERAWRIRCEERST